MSTVTITIDGTEYEVDATRTVIQAAAEHGVKIPHFCWHPKLSVSGNCRMCLVEIEKMPKLAIACSTLVAPGMVVRTNSEKVVKAREAVMEFLLINHPLDCPICDEAGECKLQNYAYKYSTGVSRFTEEKNHKPKRVSLGPNVILDVERCIMCSRCIRFADEVAHQPVLTFTQRGDRVVLTTFPGTQLDTPYSMNVIDLCPVGALTSADFRFKSRVWEMSSTESVCTGCARGCNTNVWVRRNEILRLTPRRNDDVNSYWMCDYGRLETFKSVNSPERLTSCLVRRGDKHYEVGWDEAVAKVVSEVKAFKKSEIAAIASGALTNEDAYILQRLMKDAIGSKNLEHVPHVIEGDEDELLLRADKSPNAAGVREAGVHGDDEANGVKNIIRGIADGKIKVLIAVEENAAANPEFAAVLSNLSLLIVLSSVRNATTAIADVVFSCSTFAEKNGTFVNFQGRVQRIRPAVATIELDRSLDGFAMSRWDAFGSHNDSWGRHAKRDARPSWRILAGIATALGTKMKFGGAEDVFRELADRVPAFKGLTYAKIGTSGAVVKTSRPAAAQARVQTQ